MSLGELLCHIYNLWTFPVFLSALDYMELSWWVKGVNCFLPQRVVRSYFSTYVYARDMRGYLGQ